jgi:hypothetical protein
MALYKHEVLTSIRSNIPQNSRNNSTFDGHRATEQYVTEIFDRKHLIAALFFHPSVHFSDSIRPDCLYLLGPDGASAISVTASINLIYGCKAGLSCLVFTTVLTIILTIDAHPPPPMCFISKKS